MEQSDKRVTATSYSILKIYGLRLIHAWRLTADNKHFAYVRDNFENLKKLELWKYLGLLLTIQSTIH